MRTGKMKLYIKRGVSSVMLLTQSMTHLFSQCRYTLFVVDYRDLFSFCTGHFLHAIHTFFPGAICYKDMDLQGATVLRKYWKHVSEENRARRDKVFKKESQP
jgi:hypothetical protein